MQVLLKIPEGFFKDEITPALINKERARIETAYNLEAEDRIDVVNIGSGADWSVLLATFSVAWTVIQIPGVIKKSLEGWEWLIKKLKGYITDKQLVSMDQDSAGMLAIDYLAGKYGADSLLDLIDSHTIPLVNISGLVRNDIGGLAECPDNYYIFSFRVDGRIIILGVRSTGKIRELESIQDTLCYY